MAILINAHSIKRGQTSIPFILYFHKNLINERTVAAYFFRSIKVPTYAETHGKAEDSPLLYLITISGFFPFNNDENCSPLRRLNKKRKRYFIKNNSYFSIKYIKEEFIDIW